MNAGSTRLLELAGRLEALGFHTADNQIAIVHLNFMSSCLIALARIILVSIYQMIRKKEPYNDLGPDYLDSLNRERTVKNLKRRIESLGYNVVLLPGSCPASGDGASRTLPALETPLGSIPNLTGLEVGVGRTAVLSAPEGL